MQLVHRGTQGSFEDFHFSNEKPSTITLFSKAGAGFALAPNYKRQS
jgi:hypothetical protein